jgi:hypothetical protein
MSLQLRGPFDASDVVGGEPSDSAQARRACDLFDVTAQARVRSSDASHVRASRSPCSALDANDLAAYIRESRRRSAALGHDFVGHHATP